MNGPKSINHYFYFDKVIQINGFNWLNKKSFKGIRKSFQSLPRNKKNLIFIPRKAIQEKSCFVSPCLYLACLCLVLCLMTLCLMGRTRSHDRVMLVRSDSITVVSSNCCPGEEMEMTTSGLATTITSVKSPTLGLLWPDTNNGLYCIRK